MSSFRHDLPTAAAARSASERRGAATEFGANPANRRAVVVRFFYNGGRRPQRAAATRAYSAGV